MSGLRRSVLAAGLLLGVIALLSVSATAQAYESKRVTVTGLADGLTSANYRMSVTSVPIGGAMSVCPNGSATSLGFWSILGPMAVPIRLTMDKNGINQLDIDLAWTGRASQFQIYRSSSPVDLVSAGNLYYETGQCNDTDQNATESDVLYYKVIVPTAN